MCGICGVVNFDHSEAVDARLIENMTNVLAHRGPDDKGYFCEANAGLGHRRLSIIDLEGGRQPIFNEDGSAVIIFNGEIYNYADLTSDLASRGHRFRTRSDTETILHSFEEYGEGCLDSLRGMFAFAVWDRRRKRLFAARDRLGVKPLYYYLGERFFAFASEIKSLLEIASVPRELDEKALDAYLSLRYVPGPRTMFRNIWKLQPGHFLTLEDGHLRIQRYWDVSYDTPRRIGLQQALEEFGHLLHESVRLRLVAEVPLGVFLSGGVDSSAILATMSRITDNHRIKTFSVGYEAQNPVEEGSNEFEYARMAAAAFDAEHHEYRVTPSEFRDAIPAMAWHLDEPLADPSCIPLYFISKLARRHITVVLSGEGADETMAGYSIYRRMLVLDSFRRTATPFGAALAARASAWFGGSLGHYLQLAAQPLESRYSGVSRAMRPELKQLLYPNSSIRGRRWPQQRLWPGASSGDIAPLSRMLYLDTKVWLPDDILLKADKMTMANALELRVPFLDHKLVEFAASLPPGLKLHGRTGKYLLRQAMRGLLPQPILTRTKKGFPVPTEQWLRGPLKSYARDTLFASGSICRDRLDSQVVHRIVDENESGRVNRHQEVWALLVLEAWHREFLKRVPPPRPRTEQPVEVS